LLPSHTEYISSPAPDETNIDCATHDVVAHYGVGSKCKWTSSQTIP